MKRLISFLACTFCISTLLFSQKIVETDYYLNNPKLGGDAIIKSLTKEVKDGKSYLLKYKLQMQVAISQISGSVQQNFKMGNLQVTKLKLMVMMPMLQFRQQLETGNR